MFPLLVATKKAGQMTDCFRGWGGGERFARSISQSAGDVYHRHPVRSPLNKIKRAQMDSYYLGWGGGDRTPECMDQNHVPYHLATPHYLANGTVEIPPADKVLVQHGLFFITRLRLRQP